MLASRSGWSQHVLSGQQATLARVAAEAQAASLLHYAGHAEFASATPWDVALRLANATELTIVDVLALERVPRWVVLSGCETGKSAPGPVENLGLAQSFLVKGAESVIAALRPVDDELAARFMTHYYNAWLDGVPQREAVRSAQLAVRASDPDADWPSFRLIEN